jgi:exodeoxyribonuclease V gamma subunit
MPVQVDALQEWGVGDRMLHDMLRGMHPEDATHAEWRRGTLPPGRLGARKAMEVRDQAAALAATAIKQRVAPSTALDIDIDLEPGRRLTGTVAPVYGDQIVSVTYSKLAGKHLLESWIQLLALTAAEPRRQWTAICIGRAKRGTSAMVRRLGAPEGSAGDVLGDLVAIFDAGRREPLPLPMKTSYAWADARHSGGDPERAANVRWRSGNYPGDDQDAAYMRVWGRNAPLRRLLGPPGPGEAVSGETTRLGAFAARLWLPMLTAEVGVH